MVTAERIFKNAGRIFKNAWRIFKNAGRIFKNAGRIFKNAWWIFKNCLMSTSVDFGRHLSTVRKSSFFRRFFTFLDFVSWSTFFVYGRCYDARITEINFVIVFSWSDHRSRKRGRFFAIPVPTIIVPRTIIIPHFWKLIFIFLTQNVA